MTSIPHLITSYFNGRILARQLQPGAVVTIEQAVADVAGNTTITLTDSFAAGMTKTDFTGGYAYGVVTITQVTGGGSGDTAVTLTDSGTVGMTKTNFTGGHTEGDQKDKHTILNGGNISSAKGNSKSLGSPFGSCSYSAASLSFFSSGHEKPVSVMSNGSKIFF